MNISKVHLKCSVNFVYFNQYFKVHICLNKKAFQKGCVPTARNKDEERGKLWTDKHVWNITIPLRLVIKRIRQNFEIDMEILFRMRTVMILNVFTKAVQHASKLNWLLRIDCGQKIVHKYLHWKRPYWLKTYQYMNYGYNCITRDRVYILCRRSIYIVMSSCTRAVNTNRWIVYWLVCLLLVLLRDKTQYFLVSILHLN